MTTRAFGSSGAVRSAERWAGLVSGVPSIDTLARSREVLALALLKRGDRDESRSLMLANRLLIDGFSAEGDNPMIVAWRIHVRSDFTRLIDGESSVPSATSGEVKPARKDPLTRLESPEANRFPADVWAELAAEVFGPTTGTGTASSLTVSFPPYLCHLLAGTASELRRIGRLEEARRVADRLLAFGRLLVERYPERPAAYLVLGEAHMQLDKNAWQTGDRAAVERNLELAIEATQQALALDPNHELARFHLDRRRRRLKDLRDPQ